MELQWALDLTVRTAAAGLFIAGLELWALRREFSETGIFSSGALAAPAKDQRMLAGFGPFLRPAIAVQVLAAATLAAAGPFSPWGKISLAWLLGAFLLLRWRRRIAGDGAEQMSAIILLSAFLAVIPTESPLRMAAAVLFIAAQAVLSYTTAGVAKLISPLWRQGQALPLILSTRSHGHPLAARVLGSSRGLAAAACWTVIVFEIGFGPLALGSQGTLVAVLGIGLAFHLGCAVFMGLNTFLWSFPATYPCVAAGCLMARDLLA
ncbi:hypothetical protein GCM10023081_09280 [Arthrobacter ginkgonis]|uniref:HTTM-like domain-containing protein n=1 Tax=Arthrobacter ginkgonis TaxID=1630594 RepID=A0ABP7C216_9MICC